MLIRSMVKLQCRRLGTISQLKGTGYALSHDRVKNDLDRKIVYSLVTGLSHGEIGQVFRAVVVLVFNMTHNSRDISGFNKEDMDAFLASFDTVLADCDGEFPNCCMSYSIA